MSTLLPNGPFIAGSSLFSGVACFGFRTRLNALDAQRLLIESDTEDKIEDIELAHGVRLLKDPGGSLTNLFSDPVTEAETFFAIATVVKGALLMMDNRVSQIKGYAGLFYVISTDPRHELRTTISQKAHRVAVAYETPDGQLCWTEVKNRWSGVNPAKYTLEEIKRIYRAFIGEELAQA